jgi:hypothetical protein
MSTGLIKRGTKMNKNWAAAKKELKAIGITVNTSLKGCCMGCSESKIDETVPAIYQLRNRWNSFEGGYLNHQNIGDTFLAAQVMAILNRNGFKWQWDGSEARSINVEAAA